MKKIFGTIEKLEPQDDGTLKVSGYASSETEDADGEVITAAAMKAAIPDYMKFGAVREMHDAKKAAGTALSIEVQEDGRTFLSAHIVDPIAVKKVETGVYKGFSIGGKIIARDELKKTQINSLLLREISLVDRPANPDSVFTVYKVDGDESETEEDIEKTRAFDESKVKRDEEGKFAAKGTSDENAKSEKTFVGPHPIFGFEIPEALDSGYFHSDADDPTFERKKGEWPSHGIDNAEEHLEARGYEFAYSKEPPVKLRAFAGKEFIPEYQTRVYSGVKDAAIGTFAVVMPRLKGKGLAREYVGSEVKIYSSDTVKSSDSEDLQKNLWIVERCARILADLNGLRADSRWSTSENSNIPEALRASVNVLADVLVGMAIEEKERLFSEKSDDADDLAKAAVENDHLETEKKLEDFQKRYSEALENFEKQHKENAEILQKFVERIEKLEAAPLHGGIVLKTVGKEEDTSTENKSAVEPVRKVDGSIDELATEIKKIQQTR